MTSKTSKQKVDPEFPCQLIIKTPFPSHRLASTALQALQVDAELSPLVRRKFSLVTPPESPVSISSNEVLARSQRDESTSLKTPASAALSTRTSTDGAQSNGSDSSRPKASSQTVLLTEYSAKTNRMLRVAVNGFMESLGVVLGVMERLDVDVLAAGKKTGAAAGVVN